MEQDLGEPIEQILSDPPNVWLTSFHGWSPESWGCVGFSVAGQCQTFLDATKPGAIIAIYGTRNSETPQDEQGKLLGFYQTSHETGHSHNFISPAQIENNKKLGREDKWTDAVNCVRAWTVDENNRPIIEDFAPETFSSGAYRHIGSQGVRLTPEESLKLLELIVTEEEVYGGPRILDTMPHTLKPSSSVPEAKKDYTVAVEPNGPKELYILILEGDAGKYLGITDEQLDGHIIVKVGYSKSPASRRNSFNAALPRGVYKWEIMRSTRMDNEPLYANAKIAVAGEDKMKVMLTQNGMPLGREFFRAHPDDIDNAWHFARIAAKNVSE